MLLLKPLVRADGTYPIPRLYREDSSNTTQSISNGLGLFNLVTYGTNKKNQGGPFTLSSGLFTCQIPGYYRISYQTCWASNADTKCRVGWIQYNADTSRRFAAHSAATVSGDLVYNMGSWIILFAFGDTFSIMATQDSGGNVNIGGSENTANANRVQIEFISNP